MNSVSTEEDNRKPLGSSLYRHGMLAIILILLANWIWFLLTLPKDVKFDPYGNGVVLLMLLFNHLAWSSYDWQPGVRKAFRVLSIGWLLLGFSTSLGCPSIGIRDGVFRNRSQPQLQPV